MSNFYNTYYKEISPRLKTLDLIIKTGDNSIDADELSSLLKITKDEINYILKVKNISTLSSDIIPTIMLNGSSYICKLFKNSLSYCNCKTFSARDISYIYGIDKIKIEKAFCNMNITEITEENLPKLFLFIS